MGSRTFGWIQNPSDLSKLKLTVNVFNSNSKHYNSLLTELIDKEIIYFPNIAESLKEKLLKNIETFTYEELVGGTKDKYGNNTNIRQKQQADSLLKITILPQSTNTRGKHFTDNWTADGFLRWAVTWGFVSHDRDQDTFTITNLGREYSQTADNSIEEKECLTKAILAYPPATQILSLLSKNQEPHNKFYLGNQLGFRGEKGFTSYNEQLMVNWLENTEDPDERKKIKQDIEGTSDKYARMIASWLSKLELVTQSRTTISVNGTKISGFPIYKITAQGEHALRQANGSSKNRRIPKFIMWEFLATCAANKDYLRTKRANLLKIARNPLQLTTLSSRLNALGFQSTPITLQDEIKKLEYFGINFKKTSNTIAVKDDIIDFTIPSLGTTPQLIDLQRETLKDNLREETQLDPKFIELIDIAYDGKRNRDLEILTAELLKEIYGFNVMLLGGGRKPDILAYNQNFGIIVDTKAYGDGYGKNINQADEMIRYIEDNKRRDTNRNSIEWWKHFPKSISQSNFKFLWISSFFTNHFDEQLEYTATQTNVNGGAINVENLLLYGAAIKNGEHTLNQFYNEINKSEIKFNN